MPEGRRDAILREARKLVFGACCALGGLAGLWSGMWTSAQPDRARGLTAELAHALGSVLGHFGLGLGSGIAVGLLLCLTVLKGRAEPRSPQHSFRTAVGATPAGEP